MAKIPVGATIAHAYRFAFGGFPRLLAVSWPAALLQAGLSVFLMHRTGPLMQAAAAHDPSFIGQMRIMLLFYPLIFFFVFVQATAVMQLALGRRDGRSLFSFPLGKPLWRLIGALLLAAVAALVVMLGLVLAGALLGALLKFAFPQHAMARGIVGIVIFLVQICAIAYIALRLFYLIPPAVIDRERLALDDAWRLTRGNFWRIFLVVAAVLIPLMIAQYALAVLVAGAPPPFLPKTFTPEGREALRQANSAWNAVIAAKTTGYWYVSTPLLAVIALLFHGLNGGAQAFAWRTLTDSAPVAGD